MAVVNILIAMVAILFSCHVEGLEFVYHNFTALEETLQKLSEQYPDVTNLYSIGKSVQGRDLWVIAIGQSPVNPVPLRPQVRLVANIHGNEAVGRELLLHFADYLLINYGNSDNVTSLLNTTTVHLLPSLNPDGFEISVEGDCRSIRGRANANGLDLNRNFPDYFVTNTAEIQPETQHIMNWYGNTSFTLSANLHGGSLVANYPFDNYVNAVYVSRHSLSMDNDILRYLALSYSYAHTTMHLGRPCDYDPNGFPEGITNGAAWYPLTGGIQDYSYIFDGVPDITLELSCCKYPPTSELGYHWLANRNALFSYLQSTHLGVKGFITDINGNPVPGAELTIKGREFPIFTSSKLGEYWRILLPGEYELIVTANGYQTSYQTFIVTPDMVTRMDIQLQTIDEYGFPNRSDTERVDGFKYHNYTELTDDLTSLHNAYPNLTQLYSIGKSVEERELWVLAISESPETHVLLKPHVKYVGNMHGNEVIGREMLLHLARYLLENYGINDTVTDILQRTVVHIMPSMNPDGFEEGIEGKCIGVDGRANKNGFDLNRNFPDKFSKTNDSTRQVETLAIMNWMEERTFALSANLHGGALVMSYPLDNYVGSEDGGAKYAEADDDDVLKHISLVYSRTHPTMHLGQPCREYGSKFPDGITNGADWYPVVGGMQDYNYLYKGVVETTVEMSCCKYPLTNELAGFWGDHREPLLAYIQLINTMGVKGIIRDDKGDPIKGTELHIVGREGSVFYTSQHGEFWRLLMPGEYTLQAGSYTQKFAVEKDRVTVIDITVPKEYCQTSDGGHLSVDLLLSLSMDILLLVFFI